MTRNSIFIGLPTLMACVMLLSGCTAEEMDVQNTKRSTEIRLTASMQQTTRSASNLQDTQVSTAVAVGVYGVAGGNTIANGDNAAYSVDNNHQLSAESAMTWPESGSVTIYAYAPHQESWSYSMATKIFTVAADQSSDAGYLASDLLYASQTATSQTSAVGLSFSHKLARLALTVTADASTTLTDATVKIVGTKPSTVLTLTDGTISEATGTAQDITIGSGINITAGQSQTLYAVVVPQTISANTTLIEVTAGGKAWRYHFSSNAVFVGGKSHSASITVSSNSFTSTIGGNATEPAN